MASAAEKQQGIPQGESGRGLSLLSLVVGLAAGLATYWLVDYRLDSATPTAADLTLLHSIIVFSTGWLLLAERTDFIRPVLPAALIAGIVAVPTLFMSTAQIAAGQDLDPFPYLFWFIAAGPIAEFLLLALSKSMLETGAPPKYAALFFNGLTLPLIGLGAWLFAGLMLVLLFAWAALLKQMDVAFFAELFGKTWFIMPFFGAVGGLSIALIRGQRAVLGALRFIVLLFARIAMPVMALFSLTFAIVLATKGASSILDAGFFFGRPTAVILFIALFGMMIFNGVYQNGEGGPPPAWLRLSTLVAIALFPVYTGLAAYGLLTRVGEYGLTPTRIGGLVATLLAFGYSIVLIAGLITELNWKGARWMPFVAPMNTLMAGIWVIVMIGVSSPLFDPWAMSAKSQERLLLSGKIDAAKFDYGYLRFRLGDAGEAALSRLETAGGAKDAAAIRAGVARARAASSYFEFEHPEYSTPPSDGVDAPSTEGGQQDPQPDSQPGPQPGPMDLPINPQDAPDSDD